VASDGGGAGLIAVDWGTSNLRAFRLDAAGNVTARRGASAGILEVPAGGFEAVLRRELGDWLPGDERGPPVLLSGMIGSRQGWYEAPYVACPADGAAIAKGVRRIPGTAAVRAWMAPGLVHHGEDGGIEVMRGEEVQILGALAVAGEGVPAVLCLPGTHSKWARLAAGRVEAFATYMTGELFAVLRRHSILGRTMPADATVSADRWFEAGLERAGRGGSLLRDLFGVRTAALFDRVPEEGRAGYLSGLLIGHEVTAAARELGAERRVGLIGAAALTPLYHAALARLGLAPVDFQDDVAVHGLAALARELGLLGGGGTGDA
jgi:2-dehydro-3-deoxygalactonokinase